MAFKLSQRSLGRLDGVKAEMHSVVTHAITVSNVDFGVICGLRTEAEQADLVARGASQTMKSKHLTGDAVDLMGEGVKIRWGAAWHIDDFRDWEGTAEEAMNAYIDLRRSQGRRPFIDGPHFELM